MKKNIDFFLFLLVACITLISCTDDKDDVAVATEPEADYTIMLYGCGGGNLDDDLAYNLAQAEAYGYTPRVQFTAKVKFSVGVQEADEENSGGTRLCTLTKDGLSNECVAGQGFRLDDPQNIADYITETAKRLPAKHYILILWNHGNVFSILDQPVSVAYPEKVASRGLVQDDNTGEIISIFELEEGLKRSGIKLDMVYWDVCLMNMIENIYQVKDYTNYVLGAGHLTPGLGGNYAQLMHALDTHSDLLEAMKEYVPATVTHWNNTMGINDGRDLALCDVSYADEVVQYIKGYVDALIKLRKEWKPGSQDELQFHYLNGSNIFNTDGKAHYYSEGGVLYYYYDACDGMNYASSVDLYSAFTRLGNNMLNGNLSKIATGLRISMDKMIPVSSCDGVPDYIDRTSIGLLWMDKNNFTFDYSPYVPYLEVASLDKLYSMLKFDQVTGWSRFLKENIRKEVGIRQNAADNDEYYEK